MPASRVKQYVATGLHLIGWHAYRYRKTMQNNAVILMYHRVLPEDYQSKVPVQPGMYVTQASLRLHLSYLTSRFSIISLEQLIQRLQDRQDISCCCVITFDDGWWDNYQYAYPVIQEFNVPVTIFLTTGFIGSTRWFWPEEIAWCVSWVCTKKLSSVLLPKELLGMLNCESSTQEGVTRQIDCIVEVVKQWEPSRREQLASKCERFRKEVCKESNERLLLNWDEVREMVNSGLVTFGSHTASHALLDQLSDKDLSSEIAESLERLQKETGQEVDLLAYPNGNYSPAVLHVLSQFGIRAAVTTQRGLVGDSTPLYELPRIAVHEDISSTLPLLQWRLFVR